MTAALLRREPPADPVEAATVHVIDDDDGLGRALLRLVRSVGWQGRTHGSVRAFLDSARPPGPSCIVLDVRLPDMSGLDFQSSLETHGIRMPVVVMTGFGDIPMSVRAMKAGAVDFLIKPFRDQDMLDAVARALDRDRERLQAEAARTAIEARHRALTLRERQVLDCIVEGLMNKEIADRLDLSIVTVKTHRGSLMRKMAVRTVADLIRQARVIGLLDT